MAEDTSSAKDVHTRAITRCNTILESVQEERMLALQDRRFVSIAGAQWEGQWGEQFANSIMVEVNKTSQGVEKIINDYRQNRIIVDFRAIGDSSKETASTLNGMFRADLYASKGQQATDNAFEEGVQGGIGAWRLTNVYADEYDADSSEQRIAFEAIVDADQSVFWDQNSRLYDKSDARFCIVISAMTKGAFEEEFGKDKLASWPGDLPKVHYDWFTPDVIRVAEYYEVEETPAVVRIFEHKATGEQLREYASELTEDIVADLKTEGWEPKGQKKTKRRRIAKYVMSGAEILKKRQVIAGDQIPIVPVYGKRWFIDNMERSRGHVRLGKDPQRIYNAQISKLTETASTAPNERPIFTPEQVQGHEQSWAEANLNRAPYALINPIINADGSVTPVGPIAMITPPQMQPVLAALIQITASDIADLTSADDGADQVQANISAEAMDIAATRTDAKSGIYMDNMTQSMQRCGEIYLAMARDIYVEDGRVVETMDEDGSDGTAVLAEPHTDEAGRFTIRNDLSKGKYKVISDVTEATTTRKDKTVKTLVNVAQIAAATDPELAAASLATALNNMDGEGMADLQAWNRQRLVKQGVVKPTDEEKQQMAQAAQQAAQAPPDPAQQAQLAEAQKNQAMAARAQAGAVLDQARTGQVKADTVKTVIEAGKTHAEAQQTNAQTHQQSQAHKLGMMERIKALFTPHDASKTPTVPGL